MAKMRIGELFELEKGSLQSSKCTPGEYDFITAAKEWKTHNEFSHDMEALIFAAMASGSLGRTHYVNGKFITSDLCYILTPKDSNKYPIDLKFYHFVFNSLKDAIVKNTKSGTSKESINQTNLKNYEIPYFDIEQQHLWIKRLTNTRTTKEDLASEIETQQTLLKKLRQSILQDAIEGKLTASWREQNPDVESASVLLEKIKTEKEQLVKEKKIKKQKLLPPINEDEVPFDISDSWEWTRIGEITQIRGGKRVASGYKLLKDPTPYIYLRVSDMKNLTIDESDLHYIDIEMHEKIKRYIITDKDLYMVIVGGTIGKCGIVPSKYNGMNLTENAARITPFSVDKRFLLNCFIGDYCQRQFVDKTKSVGVQKMALNRFQNTLLPLPPLNEQREIVKKIEMLFKVCDELEEQINSSKSNSEVLMQAVLKEAFEG